MAGRDERRARSWVPQADPEDGRTNGIGRSDCRHEDETSRGGDSPNAFNQQLEKKQAVYPVVHVLLLTLLPLPSLLVHAVRASLLFDSRSGREKGTMGEKNA